MIIIGLFYKIDDYYIADGLGSITVLVDSNGNIAQSYRYDSFGNIVNSSGTISQPFTYTGREYDEETGLFYYRARYYDPHIGIFLQQDPIWSKNLYPYVRNNPLNLIDPYGLLDIFGFGSVTGGTSGPVRGEGEAVGLGGYSSDSGFYAGVIGAVGVQVGGQQNYIGVFQGYEVTTDCSTPQKITLKEVCIGLEIPFLAGIGIGGGHYSTSDDKGWFLFVEGGAIGEHGALGIGWSSTH